MIDMADFFGTLFAGAVSAGQNYFNRNWAAEQAEEDRQRNFYYNDLAAQRADARTRALYQDLYSPGAIKDQLEQAGLSPSIFYGGTPGGGGTAGAMGGGASGPQTQYQPMNVLEAAQATALMAQAQKTKAETTNIQQDTALKQLQEKVNTMEWINMKQEFEMMNQGFTTEDGKAYSLLEMARNNYSFESFLEEYRKLSPIQITNEIQIQTLRRIYENVSRFDRDIMTLSEETINSKFEIDITEALQKYDFPSMNAKAAVQALRTEIQTNELTESQKNAWNNLLNRIGTKGSTGRDIAIILAAILQNFGGKVGIQFKMGGKK